MTGDESQFITLEKKRNGSVSFGDNNKGKIIGCGSIGTNPVIEDVSLVRGLKFNLLSVSQLYDKGMKVIFEPSGCTILNSVSSELILFAPRVENVFMLDLRRKFSQDICLVSQAEDSWLWHRRLGHISMNLLSKLAKKKIVDGLPKLNFEKDQLCKAC